MHRQIQFNHRLLQYQRTGAGPAVVLLHGFGEDSSVWNLQKEALSQHFQLLIPDLPGSGASEIRDDMSLEALADAVYFLLQQEGIARCIMVGHSMGGYIALAFAEKYRDQLQGLGLFHSTAYADTDEKIATREKGIAFIEEHGAHNFLKTTTPNLYSPATKEKHPTLIEQQIDTARYFSDEALIAYYRAMIQRPDRTYVLRQLTVPVLFILGKWDTAVPLQDGLAQSTLPQIAYIHVLENSGHMGMQEEPALSLGILQNYLSETFGLT